MRDQFEQKLYQMAKQEKIELSDELEERIDNILNNLPHKKRIRHLTRKAAVILAAVLTLTISVTVTAAVGLVRQRMEAMNSEKIEQYFNDIYASETEASNTNRPYTESEKERTKKLAQEYEEGKFPKKKLSMIESSSAYKGKGVAFFVRTSTFFLPDKEMTEEEILQIIDFQHKRDYSIEKMNSLIESGQAVRPEITNREETEFTEQSVQNSDAVWDPKQKLTIAYTGDLSIDRIAGGADALYLAGRNADNKCSIHKMEIGGSDSVLFYDDIEKGYHVECLALDKEGFLYAVLYQFKNENKKTLEIRKIDRTGKVVSLFPLASYLEEDMPQMVRRVIVDEEGYIYLRMLREGFRDMLMVLDADGKFVNWIQEDVYTFHILAGLGLGKDGKAYTIVYDQEKELAGIASLDPIKGSLNEKYIGILPYDAPIFDIVTAGAEADFAIWGYEGIYTYQKGEEKAVRTTAPYEAPCDWESSETAALPDGRIIIMKCTEWIDVDKADGYDRCVPEKSTFYYLP